MQEFHRLSRFMKDANHTGQFAIYKGAQQIPGAPGKIPVHFFCDLCRPGAHTLCQQPFYRISVPIIL
ncbi:hypothetical protein D3C73_1407100 [compost metagenome]